MQDPAARVLTIDPETGDPVALDGRPADADPSARLASPDQRQALAFRDRCCTEPGCSRPVTWALHAHHETAFKDGGRPGCGIWHCCAPNTMSCATTPTTGWPPEA